MQRLLDALLFIYYLNEKPPTSKVSIDRLDSLTNAQVVHLRECVIEIINMFLLDCSDMRISGYVFPLVYVLLCTSNFPIFNFSQVLMLWLYVHS